MIKQERYKTLSFSMICWLPLDRGEWFGSAHTSVFRVWTPVSCRRNPCVQISKMFLYIILMQEIFDKLDWVYCLAFLLVYFEFPSPWFRLYFVFARSVFEYLWASLIRGSDGCMNYLDLGTLHSVFVTNHHKVHFKYIKLYFSIIPQ